MAKTAGYTWNGKSRTWTKDEGGAALGINDAMYKTMSVEELEATIRRADNGIAKARKDAAWAQHLNAPVQAVRLLQEIEVWRHHKAQAEKELKRRR